MKRYRYTVLFSLLVVCGCQDSSRPKDMPPLFPCTVSVIQSGKPFEGAFVEFHAKGEQKYRPATYTDADGNAVMQTYGFPGVPAGKYTITVRKNIDDDIVYRTDEAGIEVIVSSNTYKLVDDKYSKVETSPHEIEMTSKKVLVSIDVGEAVRTKM